MAEASPHFKAPQFYTKLAGFFYLLTFLAGGFTLVFANGKLAGILVANASYLPVMVLFYDLFKPVNRRVSFVAALFSLVGCVMGLLALIICPPSRSVNLCFSDVTACLSATSFSCRLFCLGFRVYYLSPYNLIPGIIGQGQLRFMKGTLKVG